MSANTIIKSGLVIVVIILVVVAFGLSNRGDLVTVEAGEFAERLEDIKPIVIDVRTPEEFATGHLPGAINLDYYADDFPQRLSELTKDKAYAIYCRTGNRTQSVLKLMKGQGFTRVTELAGGIEAWAQSNQPVCLRC
jgi:phage shock protein E